MAGDSTRESDRIMIDASRSLVVQQHGGYHRRAKSIGEGSRKLKQRHWAKKLRNIVIAVLAIWLAAGVVGTIVSGIGFMGVMALIVASVIAVAVFSQYPKMKVPRRADLSAATDPRQLVGRTELWLEAQRPALPAPAADMVGRIGVQLDALGLQLEGIDRNHPVAREVRTLVGDTLPEMVESYRKIPQALRGEQRAGATPDEQLAGGLGKISDELGRVTRELAEGSIDDLAVKTRYLDYKYGGDAALGHAPATPVTKDSA
ncbi:hypothetical protein GRI40_11235 [Altererythrobacter aerius]|uniref:Uncharacterized protein n=1 Tax=Tsuneonella aeria TaxID=1837929 RepID=A0A6I4TIB5_9SPHN|nr:O-antigen ligase family protein [Tsuneonella aeria]MXO75790.1 hypothetical protein [Tsuneonella aeria]